jgi:predicted thioredoxin/glutaredoxin
MDKTIDLLQNIMKKGSEEFKQKTGRQMTYGEMREMYG